MMMRNFKVALLTLLPALISAQGMWLPTLLESLNQKEMKSMGAKIKADDIYNINKSSLKDAVCIFGGGCTAEVVSQEGLIFTNHHCGFDAIQKLSSLENNYVDNGFWAKNREKSFRPREQT